MIAVIGFKIIDSNFADPLLYRHPIASMRQERGQNPLWIKDEYKLLNVRNNRNTIRTMKQDLYITDILNNKNTIIMPETTLLPMSRNIETGKILLLDWYSKSRSLYELDIRKNKMNLITNKVYGVAVSRYGDVAVAMRHNNATNIALIDPRTKHLTWLTDYTSKNESVFYRHPFAWMSNGYNLIYSVNQPTRKNPNNAPIMLNKDTKKCIILEDLSSITAFDCNPIDDRVAYAKNDDIYIIDMETGIKQRIARNYTRNGFRSISWSTDGKLIAYDSIDGGIWIVPAKKYK